MTRVTQRELMPGVHLTAVHTTKFKSSYMGLQFLTPLSADTAAANALVPMVLRRGTERCPNMEALSAALDELYGGSIEPVIRKKGEIHCVGFVGSFLDDAYTPDGGAVLEDAARLMGELLLHPTVQNGCFLPAYVEGERVNLVNLIRAQVNNKRQFALTRLIQLMCGREPYGVDRLGDELSAAALTVEGLWTQYQNLLHSARIEVYYSGSAAPDRVEAAFRQALKGFERETGLYTLPVVGTSNIVPVSTPHLYEDTLDVTQGKLALGFRTGINVASPDYPAAVIFNAVYGGTTTSKLFLNVREKRSLCYYASSQLEKFKGVMLVSSGVEFDQRQEAQEEILAQLECCRQGKFDLRELEAARRSAVSGYSTLLDSQNRMEDFWLGQAVQAGNTPEELIEKLEEVTAEQVACVAQNIQLDTIYFLKGKEEQDSGQ